MIKLSFLSLSVLMFLLSSLVAEDKFKGAKVTILSLLPGKYKELFIQSSYDEEKQSPPPFQRFLVGNTRLPSPKSYEGKRTFSVFDRPNGNLVVRGEFNIDAKRVIVLLLPKSKGEVWSKVISGEKDDLGGGMRKVYNLSPYETRGIYGKIPLKPELKTTKSFRLNPLKAINVDSTTLVRQKESYGVVMEYFKEDKWIRFISSGWTLDQNLRHHTFLYTAGDEGRIYCKSVSERIWEE